MRDYHLSDILSVLTGRLVSSRHMEGLYDILGYMTGENLYTHQLPRAARDCQPILAADFPALVPVGAALAQWCQQLESLPKDQCRNAVAQWMSVMTETVGEWFSVRPLDPKTHPHRDPLEELSALDNGRPVMLLAVQAEEA